MKRGTILFIENVTENIRLIENSTSRLNRGKSTENISKLFIKKYSNTSLRKIADFRDILIHTYFGINLGRVWEVTKKDIEKILERRVNKKDDNLLKGGEFKSLVSLF